MGGLQSMFEKFLQTYQEDREQDKLKFEFLAGKLEFLGRTTLKEPDEESSQVDH